MTKMDQENSFTVDRAFILDHGKAAVRNFFAPLAWPAKIIRRIKNRHSN